MLFPLLIGPQTTSHIQISSVGSMRLPSLMPSNESNIVKQKQLDLNHQSKKKKYEKHRIKQFQQRNKNQRKRKKEVEKKGQKGRLS